MPIVVFILTTEPAVPVDTGVETHLVTGRAKLRTPKKGLEHLLFVHDWPRLQRRIVQETTDTGLGRSEEVGILLLIGNIVIAIAGPIVDFVDGVAT